MIKSKPKPDDPEESKRFIDMAREVGADEGEGAMDQAFAKVVRSKQQPSRPSQKQEASSENRKGSK
jgi:hypothetical protein